MVESESDGGWLAVDGTAHRMRTFFAIEIDIDQKPGIGFFQRRFVCRSGVTLRSIPGELRKVFKAATFRATVFGTISQNDVAGDGDAVFAVREVQRVRIARVKNIVGKDHPFTSIPRTATERMVGVDDGVVDDLKVERFALMVCAGKARACRRDEHIVAHDRFALDLHGMVGAAVAKVAFDNVHWLASGAIDGDAGIVRVMHMVLGDEVSPGALLDLDAIPLVTTTIMDVVQCDDALAHDVSAVVPAEIHAFGVTSTIMNVITCKMKAVGIGTVRTETNFTCVMDMTLIDPNLAATPEPDPMATARDLDAAQTQVTHQVTLPDIDDVLFVIGPRDDDLRILRRDDPDGGFGRAADSDVPHAIDAVGAAGKFESVTRLQGRDGFHECCAIRCCVRDDT